MSFTLFVLWLKKALVFLKHYWYVPIMVIAIFATWLITKRSTSQLTDLLQKKDNDYRAEIDQLNKVHQDEENRQRDITERYNKALADIQAHYDAEQKVLDASKKKELQQIVEETADNPDELARRVSSSFGIPVYTPPSEQSGN